MNNPFDILGMPRRFDLDGELLRRRFIELSSATHPDRFTDPLEQADAAERAAAVNGAYRVLRDPEQRAGALLELLGGPGKSDDKSLPPELLEEVLEVREKQERATHAGDEQVLQELAQWASDQRRRRLERVAQLFADHEKSPSMEKLKAIRLELNALRYVERMLEQTPGSATCP